MNVTYEIKTTEVKNYNYRTPLIGVDADDKVILKHSKQTLSHIKSITLLNLVGRNESGKIDSYEREADIHGQKQYLIYLCGKRLLKTTYSNRFSDILVPSS